MFNIEFSHQAAVHQYEMLSRQQGSTTQVPFQFFWQIMQGHQELSGKSDENKSFKSNQLAPSIYIMIELCFFSLDQWEIRIHLLWGKCFNIPHHCDPHLNQTKWLIFNDLLPLTIPGVLDQLFGDNLISSCCLSSELLGGLRGQAASAQEASIHPDLPSAHFNPKSCDAIGGARSRW